MEPKSFEGVSEPFKNVEDAEAVESELIESENQDAPSDSELQSEFKEQSQENFESNTSLREAAQMGETYTQLFETQARVRRLQVEAEESQRALQELQERSSFPGTEIDTASSALLARERERLEQELAAAQEMEAQYLGVPSDLEGVGDVTTLKNALAEYEEKVEELNERTEVMLRTEREKFLIEYIQAGEQSFYDKYDSDFEESINGKAAKELFHIKWWYTVMHHQKDWLETGEKNFDGFNGWERSIEITEFDSPEGTRQYITAVSIERTTEELFLSHSQDEQAYDDTEILDKLEEIGFDSDIEELSGALKALEKQVDLEAVPDSSNATPQPSPNTTNVTR